MKKFMYLMMAFAAVAFISCKKDDDNKKDDNKDKTEEARVLETFEDGGMLTWTGSNGCSFEVVDNPYKTGINKTAKVGKYTTAEAEWDFVWSTGFGVTETHPDFDFLNFSEAGYVVKMDVYAPVAGMKIYCKLEGVGVGAKEVNTVVTTKANEWETLEFDFEPLGVVDGKYKNFVVCVDAGGKTAGTVVYVDNLRQVKGE
ncbi:MAG: hypothetical protein J5764_05475 [Bacteroidales bacterium]|nr:hypothetical protein [Bacteroidales bacterium]